MDILIPHSEKEFTDPNYWKRFFERNSSFEWYGDYPKLSAIIDKYLKSTDNILQIGCGNSLLAEGLYDNGYRNVHSIDIDPNVISKQRKRNSTKRPTLTFEECSASDIKSVPDGSVNVAIDKGTLDALLPQESTNLDKETVRTMFKEIERCLSPFGRYIIITLAQEHIIKVLIAYFGTSQFIIRVQKCELTESSFVIPVFILIITKLKMALEQCRKIEFLISTDSPSEQVESVEKLLEKISGAQQMNWFKQYLSRGPVDETYVKLYSKDGHERYELTIVDDQSMKTLCTYGAFIIPFGREGDWIFGTPKGRKVLRKKCDMHRLVVVRLFRTQHYVSLDQIQTELDPIISDYKPKSHCGQRINYLSLGSTNTSEPIETGISEISGKWTVERVLIDGSIFRRLVFLGTSNLVQSESEIKRDSKGIWKIDWVDRPLTCEHHQHMMLALEFICDQNGKLIGPKAALDTQLNLAILGLGGGILAKVLHDTFKNSQVVGVELDKEIIDIATKHFDFPEHSERLRTEICDAFDFLEETSNPEKNKYDIIFVDLSGPANDKGLYCPPPQFVEKRALILMRESLTDGGVLTLNLVTRDDEIAANVKKTLSSVFNSVYFIKGDEDINEVMICSKMPLQKFAHLNSIKRKRKGKGDIHKPSGKTNQNKERQNQQSNLDVKKWLAKCLSEADKLEKYTTSVSDK